MFILSSERQYRIRIETRAWGWHSIIAGWLHSSLVSLVLLGGMADAFAEDNLLKNPGFEESPVGEMPTGWEPTADTRQKAVLSGKPAHSGQRSLAIPAHSSIEQRVERVKAGPYLARCWIKSEADQRVTMMLSDPARPWAAYNYAEVQVPKGEWTPVEAFCVLDLDGSLTVMLGGFSKEFHAYHGPESEMRSPILADDFELVRYESKKIGGLAIWDSRRPADGTLALPVQGQPIVGDKATFEFAETPVFQARPIAGTLRESDGALVVYASNGNSLKQRAVISPSPVVAASRCTLLREPTRMGLRVVSGNGDVAYTAWISPLGVISIEHGAVTQFELRDLHVSYGLLPSFVGSDICYDPARMPDVSRTALPSTQWFVGLVDGHDSMLVAVWDSPDQAVALGITGQGRKRIIDSLSINAGSGGFSLSCVEHSDIWHREPLKEDYLGDYTAIAWSRPFPARWMGQFFVTPGGKPLFHSPHNDYSFPVASAKTRMWGVWFEDWNHYPFYFDGPRTVVHFEKSFAPVGDALFYFLEPVAADLYSPCEIVQQVLGPEGAASLFDFDANALRKLKYSTPPLFMYDRPVCATTTRLSKIKQTEKPTVGIHLATHLYEFIREIRGRVDQYSAYFGRMEDYLTAEKASHPEIRSYIDPLENLVTEAQSKTNKIYETPLADVERRTEAMKKQLEQGQGDGFSCGNLDVRGPAGDQDDLCRRYNRQALRLMQTAALTCGESAEAATLAKHIWDESRAVLREPTRWEGRRTLYFFEP